MRIFIVCLLSSMLVLGALYAIPYITPQMHEGDLNAKVLLP